MSSLRFCVECNNLLYPRASARTKKLLYACRHCQYEEDAPTNCVYTNEIKITAAPSGAIDNKDLTLDPSLRRSRQLECPRCHYSECVFFGRSEEQMELVFVCTNSQCGNSWTEATRKDEEMKYKMEREREREREGIQKMEEESLGMGMQMVDSQEEKMRE